MSNDKKSINRTEYDARRKAVAEKEKEKEKLNPQEQSAEIHKKDSDASSD